MTEQSEKAFTESQIALADTLMREEPRIEAALKNYLSMKMAERLTSGDGSAAASAAGSATGAALDAAKLQGCARVILRTVNNVELPAVTEWGSKHPQLESEDGLKYMTRLGEYKVVQALWTKTKVSQQKPAKLLGRTALRYVMPEVSDSILADSAASAKTAGVPEADLEAFLTGFELTIDPKVENEEDCPNESELVWTTNQAAVMRERQQKREKEAAERIERAVSQEEYMQGLRNAMAPAESSGPTIEEVNE
eukprot:gnl/MRDRNA2_/MRDRNA2_98999_c0_seq1.p1 gnl/MRDRNA2_/MRDRNA2_98999_c0~~gnl/MRDRNA2_/MRDRNA2_98999_c0_seq1.p1  ORF type:complete len:252 (+),score=68.07 gnl/MRDRNA2_/MRDRNA2_98999_c0_seq1:56-811(+)